MVKGYGLNVHETNSLHVYILCNVITTTVPEYMTMVAEKVHKHIIPTDMAKY